MARSPKSPADAEKKPISTAGKGGPVPDLAEELRVEKELRRAAEEKLRQSVELFDTVSRYSSDAVWDWNLVTDELWWNQGLTRNFGYETGEIEPGSAFWDGQVHPDDRVRVTKSLRKCLSSGAKTWQEEYRFLRKDGNYAQILDRGYVMYDVSGQIPTRMIGTMIDLSELRSNEQKIQSLNAELERRVIERTAQMEAANRELESFSYSVSHDLRAPLRAIEGFTRILLEDYMQVLDPEGQRFLNLINSGCHQMTGLIDDLLTYSRLGRQEPRMVRLEMKSLVREVAEELVQGVVWKGEIEIQDLPESYGDVILVKQIWGNLIGNAIKFSSRKEHPRVLIGANQDESRVLYFVSDNGAGFDMKYADKLFGVFQRLHGRSEFEGHGVGLAIVQRLVRRHGGEVFAEAKLGKGAQFSFSLPRSI